MPTGKQIRAARVLAEWDIKDLAPRAGLSVTAVQNIETGAAPKPATVERIVKAFSDVGIEFTDNEGVRRRPEGVEIFEGAERFNDFYDFLYEHLKHFGGEVCIGNSDPQLYLKYHKGFENHKKRIEKLVEDKAIHFRILVKEGDHNFTASSYAKYRWQPEKSFAPTSFYAFGECLALISFIHTSPPYVILIKSGPLAEAYLQAFNLAWSQAKDPPLLSKEG